MPYAVPIWCCGMTCETKGHSALASIEYDTPITAYNYEHRQLLSNINSFTYIHTKI